MKNVFYAQSGGVTAVINTSACAVIETVRQHPEQFGKVYAGKNGIIGALLEELIDTSNIPDAEIAKLRHTPGGAFGSCRYKLKSLQENRAQYQRLIEVFKAHDIGTFFYNGGGDSMDTAYKVSQISSELGYPIQCIGIPKTVDNDLPFTDTCPGFGSVAKYVATSIREAAFDVASMSRSSTKIFVLEVMGRHAGWITAACGLAAESTGQAPHILLFPEILLDEAAFLAKVDACVKQYGYCVIAVSEGIRNQDGKFLSETGLIDAFGHAQLGGVAPMIAQLIQTRLGYKYHWAVADYLQRAARHLASAVDVEQAYALGQAAVECALAGQNGVMPYIKRMNDAPYQWTIETAPLEKVANQERFMPRDFISADGFHITDSCRAYLQPLIEGENYPPYRNGLPDYVVLEQHLLEKKLIDYFIA